MLGLEYSKGTENVSNGLSVLIRLTDGRFIVIDGGFNRTECADALIKAIKEQSKAYTNKPVIAGWIITHAHGDHSGMIGKQYGRFTSSGITVQKFFC